MPMGNTQRFVSVGDCAPDATLHTTEGQTIQLSEFWGLQPIVVVLLRHLGCTFCREQIAQLRRDYAKFQDLGVQIVCIAQGDPKTGKAFSILFDLPFPLLLCGSDLTVYQQFGLTRGTLWQLFGVHSFIRGVRATLQGHQIGRLVGDGFQMPGVFLIDTKGIVRFVHRHRNATDNPSTHLLLGAAQDLPRQSLSTTVMHTSP